MEKKNIAIFDFDGTLTQKDTLLEFIKYVKGNYHFYLGFFIYLPILVAYKLKFYPNWKAKQKLFSFFFKGMSYNDFCKRGKEFSNVINRILRKEQIEILKKHHQQEDKIYVISASIEEWVAPWCKENGIENLICTKIEVDEKEVITGRFSSANCFGKEKVNRFLEMEPMRDSYFLYAYGDSAGDEAIINFADKGIWCK